MSSITNTAFRKIRSEIARELLQAGYAKSSREYKRLSVRLLRERSPEYRALEKQRWKAYYARKGKEWNAERIKKWRDLNPSRWKDLMRRANERGLYERYYQKHRDRLRVEKRDQQARVRRGHPLFGFRSTLAAYRRGGITLEELFARCGRAIAFLDGQNEKHGADTG